MNFLGPVFHVFQAQKRKQNPYLDLPVSFGDETGSFAGYPLQYTLGNHSIFRTHWKKRDLYTGYNVYKLLKLRFCRAFLI